MNVKQIEQMLALTTTLTKLLSEDDLDSYAVRDKLYALTTTLKRELEDYIWHQYCEERGINA